MKKFLILAATILSASPAFAAGPPFRYETDCALQANGTYIMDRCVVIETREDSGALKARNIYSNRFSLTIKSWFDKKQGFMTWDSHNQFPYKWQYKVNQVDGLNAWTMVMPGVYLQSVSWD